MSIIFETVHGSRLYGLSREGSDFDIYQVRRGSGKTTHNIRVTDHPSGRVVHDITTVSLETFLKQIQKGSPQAVEALYSREKYWQDETYRPMLESYTVTGVEVADTYRRTIRSFCYGDYKQRVHAVRLALNLSHILDARKFDPTLTEQKQQYCQNLAQGKADLDLWNEIQL